VSILDFFGDFVSRALTFIHHVQEDTVCAQKTTLPLHTSMFGGTLSDH
jgi:hypothetical protein